MIHELETLPHPLDDIDEGYGDEDDVRSLDSGAIDASAIESILKQIHEEQESAMQEPPASMCGPEEFGEVDDPYDDDVPDPDDFLGGDVDDD